MKYLCHTCSFYKEQEDFPKNTPGRSRPVDYRCRDCYNAYRLGRTHKLREENYEAYKARNQKYNLKQMYGLSVGVYEKMLEEQNGVCAICPGVNPDGTKLCVDHDHKNGVVRKLLCSNCNRALGLFGDNPKNLARATEYLLEHKDEE